jgi:hypothetical protein
MDYSHRTGAAEPLLRVPTTVFLFLGFSRRDSHEMGVVGAGLQLDMESGEFAWGETTISVDLNRTEVKIFLESRGIQHSGLPEKQGITRIPILQAKEYLEEYENICDFLQIFKERRFLRLGNRAFLDPWDLDSRDAFILRMCETDFSHYFIADPRGQPLSSEVTSRKGRHSPLMVSKPPGIPDPGAGGWI